MLVVTHLRNHTDKLDHEKDLYINGSKADNEALHPNFPSQGRCINFNVRIGEQREKQLDWLRQTLTTSPSNHIRFFVCLREKNPAKWKTGSRSHFMVVSHASITT